MRKEQGREGPRDVDRHVKKKFKEKYRVSGGRGQKSIIFAFFR